MLFSVLYKCGYILFITLLTDIARLIEHKSDHRQSSSIDADPNRIHGPNTAHITFLMIVHFHFLRQRKLFKDFEWVNIGEVNHIAFCSTILINVNSADGAFYIPSFKAFGLCGLKFSCHCHCSVKSAIFILGAVAYVACFRNILFRYLADIRY